MDTPKKAAAGELPDELARQAEIRFNARTGRGELTSWRNSLPIFLADVCEAGLEHVEVLLEHRLPLSPKRVDVVLCGFHPLRSGPDPSRTDRSFPDVTEIGEPTTKPVITARRESTYPASTHAGPGGLMSALLPSRGRPTGVAAAVIPAPRVALPPETFTPEPALLPRPRPAAVWDVVAGMAAGAVGTLTAAVIVTAPAALPHTAPEPPPVPEPRVAFDGTVTVPGRELTAFGDGAWQVGVDVVPGTYTSTGGPDCRYALRAAVTGGDIAASTVAQGPATVVLAADSGYLETSGCATWRRTV